MPKKDWSSVSLPTKLMKELDIFLETEQAKKIDVSSRSQIISFIIRHFVENTAVFGSKSIQDESDERLEKIESKVNKLQQESKQSKSLLASLMLSIYENKKEFLPKEIMEKKVPIKQEDFKKDDGMIGIEVTEDYVKIQDDELDKPVLIEIKNNKLLCSHDKTDQCKHVQYALTKNIGFLFSMMKKGIKMPGEDFVLERLQNIANQDT